jgi:hypothetical protein
VSERPEAVFPARWPPILRDTARLYQCSATHERIAASRRAIAKIWTSSPLNELLMLGPSLWRPLRGSIVRPSSALLTMTSAAGNLSTRIKQVLAFIAIVWAVAASFVAFELAALTGFGLLLETRWGRALALSETVRTSTTCLATSSATTPRDPSELREAAVNAWTLGVIAGMHAMISRWDGDSSGPVDAQPARWRVLARERSARAARSIEQLAGEMQVPKPGRFTAQQRADANTAYMNAVEADADGTARAIAGKYSETACHLYKLGAYWGYASEVRVALPGERSVFGVEIEHHARRAGLPSELWVPAITATASNATTQELAAETQQLTLAINKYLMNAR